MDAGSAPAPEHLRALVEDVVGRRPAARARLLELAAASRASRDGRLDAALDDLAARAAAGDEAAVEAVLEVVHRLGLARPAITSIILDHALVDDVAQSALVAVESRIGSYEGRSKFRTWLHTVARNEALMAVRRRQAEPVDEVPEAPGGTRFSSVIASRQTVKAVIDGLPEPYRATISLQLHEDLDYEPSPPGWMCPSAPRRRHGAPVGGGPAASRTGEFDSVAFSPDGATVLAGTGTGEVHVWSLPSRELRDRILGGDDPQAC